MSQSHDLSTHFTSTNKTYERIKFRVFQMPCCGQLLCWVNPRLPNCCPECGQKVYMRLRNGQYTQVSDDNAILEYNAPSVEQLWRNLEESS